MVSSRTGFVSILVFVPITSQSSGKAYSETSFSPSGRATLRSPVLENAKEQIKVRNELIKEYQEEEQNYRKGLVKKVIHIQSEKDFRNQEISRYKSKLKEYEESSIER